MAWRNGNDMVGLPISHSKEKEKFIRHAMEPRCHTKVINIFKQNQQNQWSQRGNLYLSQRCHKDCLLQSLPYLIESEC